MVRMADWQCSGCEAALPVRASRLRVVRDLWTLPVHQIDLDDQSLDPRIDVVGRLVRQPDPPDAWPEVALHMRTTAFDCGLRML